MLRRVCLVVGQMRMAGYSVECNEFSKVFVSVADFVFNGKVGMEGCSLPVHPMAHVYSENWRLSDQYFSTLVPQPSPGEEARRIGKGMRMTAGDMVAIYKEGGPGHRKFDSVVTCFFIDTGDDLVEYFRTIDQVSLSTVCARCYCAFLHCPDVSFMQSIFLLFGACDAQIFLAEHKGGRILDQSGAPQLQEDAAAEA